MKKKTAQVTLLCCQTNAYTHTDTLCVCANVNKEQTYIYFHCLLKVFCILMRTIHPLCKFLLFPCKQNAPSSLSTLSLFRSRLVYSFDLVVMSRHKRTWNVRSTLSHLILIYSCGWWTPVSVTTASLSHQEILWVTCTINCLFKDRQESKNNRNWEVNRARRESITLTHTQQRERERERQSYPLVTRQLSVHWCLSRKHSGLASVASVKFTSMDAWE